MTLVEGGEVYAPEPLGEVPLLLVDGRIAHLGPVDVDALKRLPLSLERVDASGCIVAPGFVDPHAHLVGTGGEQGWASRTGDVSFEELTGAGVTTVVGCLGTDDITRSLATLLGRCRQLRAQGLTALAYTGSFYVPTPTLTGSVRSDLTLLRELVGVGEVAIADFRSNEPSAAELARIASEALVGGLLGENAGVVHFHVGPGARGLQLLFEVLDQFTVPARHLYPTHITRSEKLMDQAILLSQRGAFVDTDTIEPGVGKWIRRYAQHGGAPGKLTASSDAHAPKASETLHRKRFLAAIHEEGLGLGEVLPVFTRNPADALKLERKGRIAPGADADLQLMAKGTLELRGLLSRGRHLVRDGKVLPPEIPDV